MSASEVSPSRVRVLVVDDDPGIVELLRYVLRQAGHSVVTATTGAEALTEIRRRRPALILLDCMLPDMRGLDVCHELKRSDDTEHIPIIMVTAKNDEVDRVVAFELGIDDYIAKPFSPREVTLRVAAVLRRAGPAVAGVIREMLTLGPIEIDVAANRVRVAGDGIELSRLEFALLHHLVANVGRVQTRAALLEHV